MPYILLTYHTTFVKWSYDLHSYERNFCNWDFISVSVKINNIQISLTALSAYV